jgi:hypothetical protein
MLQLPGRGWYRLTGRPAWPATQPPATSRRVYAAAHVAARPAADGGAVGGAVGGVEVDWDQTLGVRHGLWALGLGVAEAMDTAQRGMGVDWPTAAELIRRSAAEARAVGGAIAAGAGTDQLDPRATRRLYQVREAYREQIAVVEAGGATVILMASRALAAVARGPEDYLSVYGSLLEEVRGPVILHWLGAMFDPALNGYWGTTDLSAAQQTVLTLINGYPEKVDGIKVSLLDPDREVALRRALPPGVRLYTGDDLHYPELILGDEYGHSDALLGILDAIARPAAAALACLDRGDVGGYQAALAPTVPLARHIFRAPTYHYKTGLAFLAWLNGAQEHFRMIGGYERARDAGHLTDLFVLADRAGVLAEPDLAVYRMRGYLASVGASA